MPFQPGNEESKKANHKRPRILTQQLISALNEVDAENVPKIRRVVDALIARAIAGDSVCIREIADRVEGKVPQAIAGEDGEGPVRLIVETGIYRGNQSFDGLPASPASSGDTQEP